MMKITVGLGIYPTKSQAFKDHKFCLPEAVTLLPFPTAFPTGNLRNGFGFLCTSLLALIPLHIHIGTLLLYFLHKPCPVPVLTTKNTKRNSKGRLGSIPTSLKPVPLPHG